MERIGCWTDCWIEFMESVRKMEEAFRTLIESFPDFGTPPKEYATKRWNKHRRDILKQNQCYPRKRNLPYQRHIY